MKLAIAEGNKHPKYPFGAVIVDTQTGEELASAVNSSAENPTYHGEIAAMDDYVSRHGNRGWDATTLYTTAEPCSMCMSALVWANVRHVVWGTSIKELRCTGITQIAISAKDVTDAARSFYTPALLRGGVLADRTDELFKKAQRLRQGESPTATEGECHR